MSVNIRPVAGKILLQIKKQPEKNVGGVVVPETVASRGAHREAFVKALPNNYRGDLRVGDLVLCPPWPDREFVLQGDTLAVVPPDKIVCKVD